MPWQRVVIRPAVVRNRRVVQFQRYDDRHCDTRNAESKDDPVVAETLHLAFRNVTIQLENELIQARTTKRGGVVMSTKRQEAVADTSHDRKKPRRIPEDAPFLEVLGTAAQGRVLPSKQRKYRQIGEFVRAMVEAPNFSHVRREPVRIIDLGCGNAYLTFALYHYLSVELGSRCEVLGVDRDADAIARNRRHAQALGWDGMAFSHGDIDDLKDATEGHRPAIVVALHACDTATDDAIARAVGWQAELLLAAPCCHHDLQTQLTPGRGPAGAQAMLHSDLLRERLGDVLTDGARVALLRLAGYRAQVLQFVTLNDSAKNLLIRAVRTGEPADPETAEHYAEMKRSWQVTPYLEGLLRRGPASGAETS